MENDQDLIETDLIIDSGINLHLKETAAWGKFLAVAGFIYSGFIAIVAIYSASVLTKLSGNYGRSSNRVLTEGAVAILYLAFAGIAFFMSVNLFRFAKKTQAALQANDQVHLEDAFKHLKIYFRFAGIITVIGLIFSVLGVIGIMMTAAFTR
jgi:Family of unknown function (DUF5362)